jgi:pimeloyl-ACP methyl ester carboxylesterase
VQGALPQSIPQTNGSGFCGFDSSPYFGERVASFTLDPEVRVLVNAPPESEFNAKKQSLLIFYALPNGNTIEQTIGKALQPGDDWHYDIQHIGAQTRFLRELLPDQAIVVAYLANNLNSWPAWRKKYPDQLIPEILGKVTSIFADSKPHLVLAGHSGGGSLIFGYLNAVPKVPDNVERIAFVDSNYAYDHALGHREKLVRWLKADDHHALCVLAYNDAVALLNVKSFVSAAGGTWGKSWEMLGDLERDFEFTARTNSGIQQFRAADGRVQFLLKENPERKILHTVQVERNGFIHALVTGSTNENRGYEYFGSRAYGKWVTGPAGGPELRSSKP